MKRNIFKRLVRNIRETYKNKLSAIVMIACGLALKQIDNDGTGLALMLAFGIPLFFSGENIID